MTVSVPTYSAGLLTHEHTTPTRFHLALLDVRITAYPEYARAAILAYTETMRALIAAGI